MAGDWIKWQKGLVYKPKVMRIAHLLGKSRFECAALCMVVWEWCDDNMENCYAVGVTKTALDDVTGVRGFGDALVAVGWVVEVEDGLCFPNFERHNGQTAKIRASTKKRMSDKRKRDADGVTNVTRRA